MKYPLYLAVLAASSFNLQAETQLHPIVTASRIAQSADQTMSAVTVISRDQINASQNQSSVDLLRDRIPGLDFLTTGGTGHQVSTFIRGTNSDHFLLMIDGNIIGSATTGSAALDLIPLDNIERIEVVRGPRSSLYGSDAIGGVIQVFTRAQDTTTASLTAGSLHTSGATVTTQFGNADTTLNLALNHYQTRGINVTNDSEDDADGYTNDSINLRFKHALDERTHIFSNLLYADGNTEFDNNSYDNESDSVQQNYQLGLDVDLSKHWNSRFDIGQSKDELVTNRNSRDFFDPNIVTNETTIFITKRDQAHWQNQISFGDTGQSSLGLDYINDKVDGTTAYSESERSNAAAYGLVQDTFGHHQLQAAARLDDNEAFGTHTTGSLAWAYDISGNQRIRLSQGSAFIAPTFNDLYFVDPFFNGNPDLDPETSRTSEISYSNDTHWGNLTFTAYRTLIKNLIMNVSSNPADPFAPFTTANASRAKINGAELELSTATFGWDNQLSLSFIDPINESSGKVLQNRAKRSLKLSTRREIDDYQIYLSVLAQSSRFADANNTQELAGYGIVNLSLGQTLDKHWRIQARVENLFDKEYSTSVDFFQNTTNNTPLSLFLSLHYQQ